MPSAPVAMDSQGIPIALPPAKPMRLETDTFCEYCNYNLFGQEVIRDDRLHILICRCPECGRFHPAGRGVSSSRVWLNRFGMFMLVVWVLFCLALVSIGCVVMGGMQYAYLENFTRYVQQTPDGRPVHYQSAGPNHQPVWATDDTNEIVRVMVTRRIVEYRPEWDRDEPYWQMLMPFVLVSSISAMVLGTLFSVAFWHWKRRGYIALILPVLAGSFVLAVWRTEPGVNSVLSWSIAHIAMWTVFDMAILTAGLLFGRRVARVIVSVVIPPKPRQHFAFLWAADGKKWPFPQAAGKLLS